MDTKRYYSKMKKNLSRQIRDNMKVLKRRAEGAIDLVKKTVAFLETRASEMNETPYEMPKVNTPAPKKAAVIEKPIPQKTVAPRKTPLVPPTPKKKNVSIGSIAEQNRRQSHQSSSQKRAQGKHDHRQEKPPTSSAQH